MKKTFYKKCRCLEISGFCLTLDEIKKDEKYICQGCQKETKLSKWRMSDSVEYFRMIKDRADEATLLKLQKSRMKNIIPASQRNYGRKNLLKK